MRQLLFTGLLLACTTISEGASALRLADIFSDSMVLQRDQPIPVWGDAPPGASVTVTLSENRTTAVADPQGKWRADLPALPAGGPHELTASTTETLRLTDVLVGDVWLCSGQSNMQWGVEQAQNPEQEIAAANHPNIRLFSVERSIEFTPAERLAKPVLGGDLRWVRCSPETVPKFSAVGYFFGRAVQRSQKVPIGLIDASWGGMPVEAFTSARSLSQHPDYAEYLAAADWKSSRAETLRQEHREALVRWQEDAKRLDPGFGATPWIAPDLSTDGWSSATVPSLWNDSLPRLKAFNGSVWFRRDVELPSAWAGRDLHLKLGEIDDAEETWFNGERIGGHDFYFSRRDYTVPGRLVRPGRNVLVVRIMDFGGDGGFSSPAERLSLAPAADASTTLPLAGTWQYRVGLNLKDIPGRPADPLRPNTPTVLYNAMISPLVPHGLKGVIWYQGEANAPRAWQYRTLFPLLIRDWRQSWNREDLPFLFVQLANFDAERIKTPDPAWPELRQAQLETLAVPNTGMAVTIDIGDPEDIHPRNKQDVGERLALAARRIAYGEAVEHFGPMYRPGSLVVSGAAASVAFDQAAGGLVVRGEKLTGFTVAGPDKVFHPAEARVEQDRAVVSSPAVTQPVAVRYGWASSPQCNLYNKEGLPASPFKTDGWPWKTGPDTQPEEAPAPPPPHAGALPLPRPRVTTVPLQLSQLSAPQATAESRNQQLERMRRSLAEAATTQPLAAGLDPYSSALYSATLLPPDSASRTVVREALRAYEAVEDEEFQRLSLESAYGVDSQAFLAEIAQVAEVTTSPKHFAMASLYLARGLPDRAAAARDGLERLARRFPGHDSDPILFLLAADLKKWSSAGPSAPEPVRPPLAQLLSSRFASGFPVVYSLQRPNRSWPGLALVRGADGRFVRRPDGTIFTVSHLARSRTDLPGYITNGNTPQGIFAIRGIGRSRARAIGGTPYLRTLLPFEARPDEFFHNPALLGTTWTAELYTHLLPAADAASDTTSAPTWRRDFPIHTAWYAGQAGRYDILAHGTTVDPTLYAGKSWFPGTPTSGCICAKEIWDPQTGAALHSDQLALVHAFLQASGIEIPRSDSAGEISVENGPNGYFVLVELAPKDQPVTLDEVLYDALEAERLTQPAA